MEGSGRPVAMLVVGAACIRFAPILVREAVDGGLGPTATGFWRCAIGAIVLVALAAWRRAPLRLPARAIAAAALAGLVFFVDLWVWHRSIRDAGAGLATILGNTQVFLTALFGVWLFREPVGARFFGAAVAAIVGVTLLVGIGSDVQWSGTYVRGVTYGLLTGVVYATFLLAMRIAGRESRGRSPLGVMVWMTASAAVPLGVAALSEPGQVIPDGSRAWAR